MSNNLIGQGQESAIGVIHASNKATRDANIEDGTCRLLHALWKHHPRIMRRLGAKPC